MTSEPPPGRDPMCGNYGCRINDVGLIACRRCGNFRMELAAWTAAMQERRRIVQWMRDQTSNIARCKVAGLIESGAHHGQTN